MYTILIPAYEPDEKLLHLVQEIHNRLNCSILVVDDGSSDASQAIFEQIIPYVTLLRHSVNQGKGQALKTGLAFLQDLPPHAVIVTADADGQHSLTDIDRVARASQRLPNQLILGVRAFDKEVPLRSRFGNYLTRWLFRLQTGLAISDTQTGLRSFTASMIPFLLDIEGTRYEYEMNMLTLASQQFAIREVPIQTIYIDDNASSHFRPIRDGLLIYRHLFRFALASFGGFLIDYAVYGLALVLLGEWSLGTRLLAANAIARTISSICNFGLNKKLVFQNDAPIAQTALGYFCLVVGLFVADTVLLALFHHLLGFNLYGVKILVGCLLFIASWLIQQGTIFKERRTPSHELAL